jgi:hypothetical protein
VVSEKTVSSTATPEEDLPEQEDDFWSSVVVDEDPAFGGYKNYIKSYYRIG